LTGTACPAALRTTLLHADPGQAAQHRAAYAQPAPDPGTDLTGPCRSAAGAATPVHGLGASRPAAAPRPAGEGAGRRRLTRLAGSTQPPGHATIDALSHRSAPRT